MNEHFDDPFEMDECQPEYRNDPENCDHSQVDIVEQDGERWHVCQLCGLEY
jgi:hypothetical protein